MLTGQLLIKSGDLCIGVMDDLVDLSAELVVFVCQALGQILLVYAARGQPSDASR